MVPQPIEGDAYGALLIEQWETGGALEIVERDDGFLMYDPAAARQYFAEPEQWQLLDAAAVSRCAGSVLDVGAAAGRVSLELQRRGLPVLALDTSEKALRVCRGRGVRETFHGTVFDLLDRQPERRFDSILLLRNLGLLESPAAAHRYLAALDELTTDDARVVGTGYDPYATDDPDHLRYHDRNRAAGRLAGQLSLRVRHRGLATPWFDFWYMSPDELERAVTGSAWRVAEVRKAGSSGYLAVLRK
ncbi:class I SAM-dependent methyltransferase [Nocardia terpenica]|uniref:Methyltransferase type 11 n=1 Tax=Nocardia terpenica TaxID=455432 RepID=A0A291RI69_9NOCA|nr:class I SAM-dependent methyltransferase [Nocardia terpenica]ATL66824.1 methyltransferase type 11 [Nocardia terpenica]